MNLGISYFAIQDGSEEDLDYAKNHPTLADLIREQNVPSDDSVMTVHRRRDLDSLG